MDNIMEHTDSNCLKILIGNKCDLNKERKVVQGDIDALL